MTPLTEDPVRAELHRLVDQEVLALADQQGLTPYQIGYNLREKKHTVDARSLLEYWSHLVRLGVIAVTGGSQPYDTPTAILTTYGRQALTAAQDSPHDRNRFVRGLRDRAKDPDDLAFIYLDEAVRAWEAGCYRSSAVMLGCASEHIIRRLAQHVANSGKANNAQKIQTLVDAVPSKTSALLDEIRKALQTMPLAASLKDALDRRLSAVFDSARGLRNDAGHPTGQEVTRDDALARLLLFRGYYEYIDQLTDTI